MKKAIVKAGLVGSGFAASFHYQALQKVHSADVEVVGVYSPTLEKREAFAFTRNIRPFKSLDGLIDACEVVHVCTPPATHESITISALKKDRSIVVEKPLTGYFGEGETSFRGDQCSDFYGGKRD